MDERTETRVLFLASAGLAIFGTFAPFKWHDMPTWVTNLALALALFLGLWAGCLSFPSPAKGAKKLLAVILISGGITATVAGIVLYLDASPPTGASLIQPKTVLDYYKSDFENTLRQNVENTLRDPISGAEYKISSRIYLDFASGSWFGGFYIPMLQEANKMPTAHFQMMVFLADEQKKIFSTMRNSVGVKTSYPGDASSVDANDLIFSNRTYIYYDGDLSLKQQSDLTEFYKSKGLFLQLRGGTYATTRWLAEQQK